MCRHPGHYYNPIMGNEKSVEHYEFCIENKIPYLQMTVEDGEVVMLFDCRSVDGDGATVDSVHHGRTVFHFDTMDNIIHLGRVKDLCQEAPGLTGEALAGLLREVLDNKDHPLLRWEVPEFY